MSDEGGIDAVIKGHRQAKVRHWRGDADQSMRDVAQSVRRRDSC